jgi:protein-S-isoprenylcysteine O-methyltransferase Ste14
MRDNANTNDNAGILFWPPAIYLVPLATGLVAHFIYPVYLAPDGLWLMIAGGALVVLFFGLALWAERTMHRAGTNVNPYKPTMAIVMEGPYRFTRNPMYLSMIFLYLGICFLLNALWPLVFLPVVIFVITYGVIAREERYLEKKFGAVYVQYKARVRRWV